MGSNKYIITKIKCWPVFKQDPTSDGCKNEINQEKHFTRVLADDSFPIKQNNSNRLKISLNNSIYSKLDIGITI